MPLVTSVLPYKAEIQVPGQAAAMVYNTYSDCHQAHCVMRHFEKKRITQVIRKEQSQTNDGYHSFGQHEQITITGT